MRRYLLFSGILWLLMMKGTNALAQNDIRHIDNIGDAIDKIKYQAEPDGVSFSIKKSWDNGRKMLRMQHSDEMDPVFYDSCFNRGIKRGRVILATGDRPRFAVLTSALQSRLDPDLIKLGDGRIRIRIAKDSFWLDELNTEKVIFHPSSTDYLLKYNKYPELEIRLLVSQMSDRGAVVRLQIVNQGMRTAEIKTELIYGGIRNCSRTFSAAYFSAAEREDLSSNQLKKTGHAVVFSDKNIPEEISIMSLPASDALLSDKKAVYSISSSIPAKNLFSCYYIIELLRNGEPAIGSASTVEAEKWIEESRRYYASLLSDYQVETPDTLLNLAYRTSLINFDYLFKEKAWLEGIHWWSAYWTNNFQIGAAVSLGQMEKAKTALELYSSSPYGPCPILKADGKPDMLSKNGEDGLPYFIYNLIRYYRSSGDIATLQKIWPALRNSIGELWTNRDKDSNGLINWHMGANAFLYQADHLEMPGDAASPSIMMEGMLFELSRIAIEMGQKEDAIRWKKLSDKINENLKSILWNKNQGAFYNHRDYQNLFHTAHYYSDLVFPALYSSLPEIYAWQSMDYLSRALWAGNFRGESTLLRVGEFKPSIFGNDNVMPTQMTEAARAYFKMGNHQAGIKMMDAVALAATVFTEAPGNFPERMNDEGKGEANYLFGNPVGSFLDAFVSGLFGLQIENENSTLSFRPSFPESWNDAFLRLPYASVRFKKALNKQSVQLVYDILQSHSRKTEFSVYLVPCDSIEVTCNGKPVSFQLSAGLYHTRIKFQLNASLKQHIVIRHHPVFISGDETMILKSGMPFEWKHSAGISKIDDPQHVLVDPVLTKSGLRSKTSADTGWHSVYVNLSEYPVVVRLNIYVQPTSLKIAEKIRRHDLTSDSSVLFNISSFFNTDSIYLTSRWRNEYAKRDSLYMASVPDTSKNLFHSYGYAPYRGKSWLMICRGLSDSYTTETIRGVFPDSFSFPVNRKLKALSFLWTTETQSRNTNAEVGTLRFNYADGSQTTTSIRVGENLDASWKYFASASEPLLMQKEDYAKTYSLRCNPDKELKSFTIRLVAADVQIGLMGVKGILPSKFNPVVGAIRWDGWFYDTSNFVTKIVQKTLAPKEFHDRLPFFAREISADSVYINGSSQEVMDQEIRYARAGGLDYWAFVLYNPGEALSIAMKNYLQSKYRKEIHFSIITEQGRVIPSNATYLDYIRRLLMEEDYQLVENGRPLWYLGFIDSANVKKSWGSFAAMKKGLDSIRSLVIRSGRQNPYLVIMDFNAELGKRWSDSLGGDAISSYVAQKNSIRGSYAQLDREAASFWEECKSTGAAIVPICDAGWSPKPRMDFKNEWTHFYPPGNYYANATPDELAGHIRRGLTWIEKNQNAAPAQCLLIYAWNEYDEGGWLGPTLYEGKKRLDALSKVIGEFKMKNR